MAGEDEDANIVAEDVPTVEPPPTPTPPPPQLLVPPTPSGPSLSSTPTPPPPQLLVPPTPSGPPLSSTANPAANLNTTEPNVSVIAQGAGDFAIPKVIEKSLADTVDIIRTQQEHIAVQKTFLSQVHFILDKIRDDLREYNATTERLNRFLVINDERQSRTYLDICRWCPEYGDYAEELKDSPEPIRVEGLAGEVSQQTLKNLTNDVRTVFYASGLEVKNHRALCKSIYATVKKRRDFYTENRKPFLAWFHLLNVEMENQTTLSDKLFEISAFIDFVKNDDNKPPLVLDLSEIGNGYLL